MSEQLKLRIDTLHQLGQILKSKSDERLTTAIAVAQHHNKWFTTDSIHQALDGISDSFLQKDKLAAWVANYNLSIEEQKSVGLILAGNIPLVGFHDVVSVYLSGHRALVKLSSKDTILMKCVLELLAEIDPLANESITYIERLTDYDAVIATGSNTSGKYFEEYFSKVPNIIRKNRHAVAIINGSETKDDFIELGKDIFTYFGLGCRNVSKIFVPKGYNFSPMLEALHDEYKETVLHHKYKNNFDYNHALFMLNGETFLMNGCLMVRENNHISSRIASVNYEYYESIDEVSQKLTKAKDQIQCIVSKTKLDGHDSFSFGEAQSPKIDDYADGVDTMHFLSNL